MLDVFIIDDSPLALEVLKRIIDSQSDMKVQYKSLTGAEAVKLIPQLKPKIVCLDYYMPGLNGVKLVEAIMNVYPVPILIISGLISDQNSKQIFDVLNAGALDFIPKPMSYNPESESCRKLIDRIRILSKVMVVKRKLANGQPAIVIPDAMRSTGYEMIIMGSSTGGPVALREILKHLAQGFPVPIVCLQHISKGFLTSFFEWIKSNCALTCKIAENRERLKKGTVYFAPEGKNILFNDRGEVLLESANPSDTHCPSIDKSMISAAEKLGSKVLGILLTGMGSDGANGMLMIRQKGGGTIVQSEESCVVFGMPKEAINNGAARQILDLDQIANYLMKTFTLR